MVLCRLWRFSHKFELPKSTPFSFPLILSVNHISCCHHHAPHKHLGPGQSTQLQQCWRWGRKPTAPLFFQHVSRVQTQGRESKRWNIWKRSNIFRIEASAKKNNYSRISPPNTGENQQKIRISPTNIDSTEIWDDILTNKSESGDKWQPHCFIDWFHPVLPLDWFQDLHFMGLPIFPTVEPLVSPSLAGIIIRETHQSENPSHSSQNFHPWNY